MARYVAQPPPLDVIARRIATNVPSLTSWRGVLPTRLPPDVIAR